MVKSRDNFISDRACVKIIICYTDGLNFDELKLRLPVGDDDLKTASRFADEKDKVSRLISAYFKRKYVGKWTVNAFGKPVADGKYFNVSHCKGAVAIVFSDNEIGIDIERVRKVEDGLKKHVSDIAEYAHIVSDADFFGIWTAKESLAKAQGAGINCRLNEIPALPLNGKKLYKENYYFSRQIIDKDFIISVARKGSEPFDLNIINETL